MPIEQDEMFPEGASSSTWETEEIPSGSVNPLDVAHGNAVHADFNNAFDDLFDDDDLQ